MLAQFKDLKGIVKVRQFTIDNVAFRLHYRATTNILLVATLLVSTRQYIGEHIKCIVDQGVDNKVIDNYCFISTTFTLPQHYNEDLLVKGVIPHPGIGPKDNTDDRIIRHAYYQWVPFFLFLQSVMFYIPHMFWKSIEGGRLKRLVDGLQSGVISHKEPMEYCGIKIMSKQQQDARIQDIKRLFSEARSVHRSWSQWLMFSEWINLFNVIIQIYITNRFLGGYFLDLGIKVIEDGVEDYTGILEIVFPKVTKCTFHKYGPSGTIQSHDAMCVMALNIINEKIYVFLWFWFLMLLITSTIACIYRWISMVLHSRSRTFKRLLYSVQIENGRATSLRNGYNYEDALFLSYLSGNMDRITFRELYGLLEDNVVIRSAEESTLKASDNNHRKSV